MAFYLRPSHGFMSLKTIEDICSARVQILTDILKFEGNFVKMKDYVEFEENIGKSVYLLDGTKTDNTSHFILRLIVSQDSELYEYFTASEYFLFQYRFSCLTRSELLNFLLRLKKDIKHLDTRSLYSCNEEFAEIVSVINGLISGNKIDNIVDGYLHGSKRPCIQVPFTFVPKLVAERYVKLKDGWAIVPFCKLNHLMNTLFIQSLKCGLEIARKLPNITADVRFKRLSHSIKSTIRNSQHACSPDIHWWLDQCVTLDELDSVQSYMPLCVRLYHQRLRNHHALPHHSRVQYTLLLKEAGLSVHEALCFWREEYMKPSSLNKQAKWQGNEQRYIYNIRHLYGLEGSRKNYRSHSCSHIQQCSQSSEGCPFVYSDNITLRNELRKENVKTADLERILRLKEKHLYKAACTQFFLSKTEEVVQNIHKSEQSHTMFQCLSNTQEWISSQCEDTTMLCTSSDSKDVTCSCNKTVNFVCNSDDLCEDCWSHGGSSSDNVLATLKHGLNISDGEIMFRKPIEFYATFRKLVTELEKIKKR